MKNANKSSRIGRCTRAVLGGQRLTDLLLIFAALLLSALFCLGWLTAKGAVFSSEENRMLAEPPHPSASSLLSGELFSELGKFCADRAPFRLSLIRTRTLCELALGKGQSNGVLFLSNGRLAHAGEYDSLDLLNKNLDRLAVLKESYGAACYIVPRSADIYAPFTSESALRVSDTVRQQLGDYPIYDLLSSLSEQDRVYYRTDHHLDRDGAYALYRHIASELGATPYEMGDFQWETVSDSFLGSAYSDSGAVSFCADSLLFNCCNTAS